MATGGEGGPQITTVVTRLLFCFSTFKVANIWNVHGAFSSQPPLSAPEQDSPREDGARTKTALMTLLVQFIQCAALGVKRSPNILFPFFTSLIFMWHLKIIIFREDFSIPAALWMSWRSRGNMSFGWGARQEQKTNYPWPVIHGPHNLQWNSTVIVGKTINHPHLIMQINPSKFPWKPQFIEQMKGMIFFKR